MIKEKQLKKEEKYIDMDISNIQYSRKEETFKIQLELNIESAKAFTKFIKKNTNFNKLSYDGLSNTIKSIDFIEKEIKKHNKPELEKLIDDVIDTEQNFKIVDDIHVRDINEQIKDVLTNPSKSVTANELIEDIQKQKDKRVELLEKKVAISKSMEMDVKGNMYKYDVLLDNKRYIIKNFFSERYVLLHELENIDSQKTVKIFDIISKLNTLSENFELNKFIIRQKLYCVSIKKDDSTRFKFKPSFKNSIFNYDTFEEIVDDKELENIDKLFSIIVNKNSVDIFAEFEINKNYFLK